MFFSKLKKRLFSIPPLTVLWVCIIGGFLLILVLLMLPERIQEPKTKAALPPQDFSPPHDEADNMPFAKQSQISIFDGLPLPEESHEQELVSVMIDNFVSARSQHSGISKASIVFEALAEGGITRLLAIFPYQNFSRVGPVRSSRDYFVDLAELFGGIYLHAGGAPSAISRLQGNTNLASFDEDEGLILPQHSFRDLRYPKPHNLFFDLDAVREKARKRSLHAAKQVFCFNDNVPVSTDSVNTILIRYSLEDSYTVTFSYDYENSSYKRFFSEINPSPHTDQAEGAQVSPQNVIVMISPSQPINGDEKERIEIPLLGQGKAFLYRDGVKVTGIWKKETKDSPLLFEDLSGKSFCLKPGQTWISIVDAEKAVVEKL